MLATAPLEFERQLATIEPRTAVQQAPRVRWTLATRIAFRWCCLYFTLYVISTQMVSSLMPLPNTGVPPLENTAALQRTVAWVAAHILRVSAPVSFRTTGSGDKMADWALAFTLLL